jgi:hypothetical protein
MLRKSEPPKASGLTIPGSRYKLGATPHYNRSEGGDGCRDGFSIYWSEVVTWLRERKLSQDYIETNLYPHAAGHPIHHRNGKGKVHPLRGSLPDGIKKGRRRKEEEERKKKKGRRRKEEERKVGRVKFILSPAVGGGKGRGGGWPTAFLRYATLPIPTRPTPPRPGYPPTPVSPSAAAIRPARGGGSPPSSPLPLPRAFPLRG